MLKPLNDKILVKRLPSEISAGGIALPNGNPNQRTEYGEVKAVGPGRKDSEGRVLPMTLKVGDKILFMKGCGYPLDGSDFLVMHEADAMGTVD